MRVLLHSKVFYPSVGGVERVSQTLARVLHERGIDLQVLTDTPLAGATEPGAYPVQRGLSAAEKRKLVRNVDLVHSNGFSLELLPYCLAYRKPLIWTHQGHQASCLTGDGRHQGQSCRHRWRRCFPLTLRQHGLRYAMGRSLKLAVRRLAIRLARCNVCITAWVQSQIRAPRSMVIWNPVEIDDFNPSAAVADANRYTFIGRLVSQKGVDVLLEALAICHAQGKPYGLDVFGDGPERESLQRQAANLALSDAVRFHGAVQGERLVRAMDEAAAVSVPSTYEEAMGIVAVEAMAAGKPLIVSRHGGLAEVSAGCSLLFENGDAHDLAAQMIRLSENDRLRRSLAEEGPRRAEAFRPQRIAEEYMGLYRRVIGT